MFAAEEGIPLADRDSHTGGIVLIGWSLGGQYMLSVLAYADEFPEETRLTLHKYLHTTISHGENFCSNSPNTIVHTQFLFRYKPNRARYTHPIQTRQKSMEN